MKKISKILKPKLKTYEVWYTMEEYAVLVVKAKDKKDARKKATLEHDLDEYEIENIKIRKEKP